MFQLLIMIKGPDHVQESLIWKTYVNDYKRINDNNVYN